MTDTTPAQATPLLERNLLDIGIPPCPDILNRIMEEMQKEEPDHNRLTRIISADVALAAGLIKTINSPFFFRRQKVRSVHEALTILGLRIAGITIAGLILRNVFPSTPSMVRFWDGSARSARLCAWLAGKLDIPGLDPDAAYTFGLFHDSGIAVLMGRFHNYADVLAQANRDAEKSFTFWEEEALGMNHAEVGCALAQSWLLPEDFSLGILHHHNIKALDEKSILPKLSRQLIATTQLAEHISQQQLGLSLTQEWPKLGDFCLQTLLLDEGDMEFLFSEAKKVLADLN